MKNNCMRKKILFIFGICLSGSGLADCNEQANQARKDQRLDEAIEILTDCLEQNADRLARTHLLLGLSWHEKGEQEKAIANYTKAIQTVPNYAVAYTNRGLSNALLQNFDKALSDFDHAIELRPDYGKAHYFRGFTNHLSGDYERAIANYDRALESSGNGGDTALIHYRRGLAYTRTGERNNALADYDQAIEKDPALVRAWFARGLSHHRAGEYEAAITDYSQVIELEPKHKEALFNRGLMYSKTDAGHLAKKDYNRATQLDRTYARAHTRLAILRVIPLLPLLLVAALG